MTLIPNETSGVIAAALLLALGFLVVVRVVVWRVHRAALVDRARSARQYHRTQAERAVADERRRIARELHDMIAHHVSVLGVLAAGARRAIRTRPQAADRALASIEEDSRATLRQMRRLLYMLRTDVGTTVGLSTQLGLSSVETLVKRIGEAGLPVTLHVDGPPDDLHPGIEGTVHRIVHDVLADTREHAGAASVDVRLSLDDRWVTVVVSVMGRGVGADPPRLERGMPALRERVAVFGGTLSIKPRPAGGFQVGARLPIDPSVDTTLPG